MKNQEDLLKLKGFLERKGLDFMVVGSTALQICGIPLREEPHDIDIEVATIMFG